MKIGDVSKFLHISDQMIRYYEKNGVISPKRSGNGNYREYTEMDVFLLFDALKYKEWNINIKDIHELVDSDYYNKLSELFDSFKMDLDNQIEYKTILKNKITSLQKDLKLCRYNLNHFWVDSVPAKMLFYSGTSQGDQYGNSELSKKIGDMLFSSKYISFFDLYAEFNDTHQTWYYSIEEQYYQQLNLKDYSYDVYQPEQYCLCTVINMGEKGEFSSNLLNPMLQFINQQGYKKMGNPFGIIIGRGNDNHKFCRMMKVFIPIKSL